MQCLFIKNLYNFYIDFEQFNEKAVGLFCWFANIQLAISRSAENLRRLMNDGEEGYLGQGSDTSCNPAKSWNGHFPSY